MSCSAAMTDKDISGRFDITGALHLLNCFGYA
jgi:hypothetical protein